MKTTGTTREVAAELADAMAFWRRTQGRYVWWLQILAALVCAAAVVAVWSLAGAGWGPPVYAGFVTFVALGLVALLAEAEARVTTRQAERARQTSTAGRAFLPDGYVLAYELGGQPGQIGSGVGFGPFLTVAAIRADRWDLTDPLWRFTVLPAAAGGIVAQLPSGTLARLEQAGPLAADIAAACAVGPADRDAVIAAEGFLVQLGARDVTSTYFQPPAAG